MRSARFAPVRPAPVRLAPARLAVVALGLVALGLAAAPVPAARLASAAELVPGAAPGAVPVRVEQDSFDSCTLGRVTGLKPVPGNTLSVRAGPGRHYAELDRLALGETVLVCDFREGWHGVVYDKESGNRCEVRADQATSRPNRRLCRSGWVAVHYLELIAG